MNPARRRDLTRANALIDVACEIVADAAEREREARARVPAELSDTDRARSMELAVKSLDQAKASLKEAQEHIQEAMQ